MTVNNIDGEIDAVSQIEIAARNPLSALIGGVAGGLVPLGTFTMIHYEIEQWWSPAAIIPAAGLVFSALTVYQWSRSVFGSPVKAAAFVTIAEGMMAGSSTPWLNYTMLIALIAINAIGNGCWLARRRDSHRSESPQPTPRYVAMTKARVRREDASGPGRPFTLVK